jgi:hypothetical protein
MYFYFATRYENTVAGYPLLCLMVAATKYSRLLLNVLLSWHADPGARERKK